MSQRTWHRAFSTLLLVVMVLGWVTPASVTAAPRPSQGADPAQNLALDPAAAYDVYGTVTDVNTGWPLYAKITVSSYADPIWTDPVTGYYSITLPEGITYTFTAEAWVPGYLPESREVGPLTGNVQEDFALDADMIACTAPGYVGNAAGVLADFEAGVPPAGWTVIDNAGNGVVWTTIDGAIELGNYTNGSGEAATVSSAAAGMVEFDTELRTAVFDTTGWLNFTLRYTANYQNYLERDYLDVDISTDGGTTWTNVLSWNESHGELQSPPGEDVELDLSAYIGSANTLIRWHYYDPNTDDYDWYAQIDDVAAGYFECFVPADGGLVVGNVYDLNTNDPLNGAEVASDAGLTDKAMATPDDPDVDDAFYTIFSVSGSHPFTATFSGYGPDFATVNVLNGDAVKQDFYLNPGDLTIAPDNLHVTLPMGDSTTEQLDLSNSGAADLEWKVAEKDGGFILAKALSVYTPPAVSSGQAEGLKQQTGQVMKPAVGRAHAQSVPQAPSAEIYLNQPPNQVTGSFADSDCDLCDTGQQSIAENFTFGSPVIINQIVFWTGYYPSDTPIDPDQITVIFHQDAAGLPGAAIYTEANVAYERVQTGVFVSGVHEWMHTLTLASSVWLPAGNYWVEIYNNTVGSSEQFLWETGDLDPVNGLVGSAWTTATPGSSWNYDGATELALQLVQAAADVPWVSEAPISGTLPAGDNQIVDVTFDAGVVGRPGDYLATLVFNNSTPYGPVNVPVTMTVTAPVDWGKLEGTVTGLGYCDNNPAPLEGAMVVVNTVSRTITLTTDVNGYFNQWFDEAESPVDIMVMAPEHADGLAEDVVIAAGVTTTVDFDLRWLEPCVSVDPTAFEVTVGQGYNLTVPFDLLNGGAVSSTFELSEQEGGYVPAGLRLPQSAYRSIETAPVPQVVTIGDLVLSGSQRPVGVSKAFTLPPRAPGAVTLTHSLSQQILAGNSAACVGDFHTDNSYIRVFDLQAFGITGGFEVTNVQVGIEQAVGAGGQQPATVNLYTLNGPLIWANLTLIGTADTTVSDQSLTIVDVPVSGVAPADSILVVEFFTPDGQSDGNSLFVGSNNLGQTAPTYLAAADCGFVEPTDVADIGFPDMHLVMNVVGEVSSPDVPWLFETPITGTIDADSDFLVDVTFETVISPTWTLDLGTYTATLRVQSDDPMTGTIDVPVTLHVAAPAYGVAISGDQSLTGLPGETVTYTVIIINAGNGPQDTYTVTLGASAWTSTLSDDVVGPLGVGESAAVEVVVEIPADALVGDTDVVQVTAASQGDPGETASADLTTEVAGDFGVDLAPEASAAEGAPGDMITYTLRLTNTGTSMADTFAITVTGVLTDWVVELPVTSVTLDPGEGVDVIVHVTIPAGAASGDSDEITVVAASAYDVAATDAVAITTTVELAVIFLPIITKLLVMVP